MLLAATRTPHMYPTRAGDLPQALGRLDPRHTLVAGNLECCITNSSQKVPKVFNFKLSPSNVGALRWRGCSTCQAAGGSLTAC